MSVFLVEAYTPRGAGLDTAAFATRAHAAAREVSRTAGTVRYLRSIFVPGDETCFHLFEAPSAEAVWEASRRAALSAERVVEALQ